MSKLFLGLFCAALCAPALAGTRAHNPPIWNVNPIVLAPVSADNAFSMDISIYATWPESTPIAFSMTSGPAWLTLASQGVLSGTPAIEDVGDSSSVVEVCNYDGECASTVVDITVLAPPR